MNSNRRILALIGASLLILGFFMPLVSFLGLASVSYFDLVRLSSRFTTGLVIVALGALSLALALKNNYKPLLATGIAALLVLGFDFVTYKSALRGELPGSGIGTGAGGVGPGGAKLDLLLDQAAGMFIQPTWGMFVLAASAILLIIAGAMKDGAPQNTDWRNYPPPPSYR